MTDHVFFFFLSLFTLKERERERTWASRGGAEREGKGESQTDSTLSKQSLIQSSILQTTKSWTEWISRVVCLTAWDTQAPGRPGLKPTSHPCLWSCDLVLHFLAGLWGAIASAFLYLHYQEKTEGKGWLAEEEILEASVHPQGHFTAAMHPHEFLPQKRQVFIDGCASS